MARSYVLIGDVHATRRAPSSCTDSYMDDLWDLLRQVLALCREREAVALVIAGDLWHHKAPSRTDHGLVQDMIRLFRSAPCPVYVVPGNHDQSNDRLESIRLTQPLGVLFEAGAARWLDGWLEGSSRTETFADLYGVGWQQDWSQETIQEALAGWREPAGPLQPALVVTHAPIYPPGRELKWENTPASWWAEAMGGAGSLFYGHVHEPHGVFEASGVTFCNNGALSRGSLHEYNLNRQVGATVWDAETGEFEFVPLDAKPAGQVFRLREHEKTVTSQAKLADFLVSIGKAELPVMSVEAVIAHIGGLDADPEVK